MRFAARSFFGLSAIMVVGWLQGCASLPPLDTRVPSVSIRDTADSRLGRAIVPLVQAHPERSGVVPLLSGRDAFATRMRLADAAERSLDVRYYISHKDLTGTLLLDVLRRAADRGVRVRLLLDDNGTSGLDDSLAALDAHPKIEVRLFNPFRNRNWRPLGYLFDFARLNRRMHNKSFTADNQATVIGGRNVGDEYFGAGNDFLFVDLDVLAIGPVVDDVSSDFDRYWASASSFPVRDVLPPIGQQAVSSLAAAAAAVAEEPAGLSYMQAVAESPFVQSLLAHTLDFDWAQVSMVSDDPAKGLGVAPDDELLWARLKRVMKRPEHDMKLVSAYFVPGAEGVAFFSAMAASGVKVAVLTNSLEATDVAAVHAGYAKRRKALLEAGVRLFDLKRIWEATMRMTAPVQAPAKRRGSPSTIGSSGSSLHAKTFSLDGSRIFIGSFNFDPRSARLNTEMGFVIDSPALAQSVVQSFARDMPQRDYEVRLTPDGSLNWIEHDGDKEIVHVEEPGGRLLEAPGRFAAVEAADRVAALKALRRLL